MFALEVEYLSGRVYAAQANDYDAVEWPPHPARLFSALVAAWTESGKDDDGRKALTWLETQPPPALSAGPAYARLAMTHYVPVNDASVPTGKSKKAAAGNLQVLPAHRSRQARTFPSATLERPIAQFMWQDSDLPADLAIPLARLVETVTYLGHSACLVSVRLTDHPRAPDWRPTESGDCLLRVPGPGQLQALETAFRRFEATGQRGLLPSLYQAYSNGVVAGREAELAPVPGPFGKIVVFRVFAGSALPITRTLDVTRAFRGIVLKALDGFPCEALSGHFPDGRRLDRDHVAYVTLPDVGHRHADGHIMGVAAVMPKILGAQEEQQALATLASLGTARLKLGQLGAFPLERVAGLAVERGLRPDTWGAASRNWASVTPIVLDKFPKKPFGEEACAIVAESCVRAGFPMPVRVVLSPDSRFAGVQSSRQFPATERRGSLRRFHVHAILEFENLVGGPMIVGAGRYVGMGLCRPVLKGL